MKKEQLIADQIELYKQDLIHAKFTEENLTWVGFYERRLESLTSIISIYGLEKTGDLNAILKSESRAYGWSFAPGDHGEKAENSFWKLKDLILARNYLPLTAVWQKWRKILLHPFQSFK